MRIVIDTNVLVAGLRSRRGKSFRLLAALGSGLFQTVVTVSLVIEYEAVLRRQIHEHNPADVEAFLDYLISASSRPRVSFRLHPLLPDPADELVLEAAIAGDCDAIVTFNTADFVGVEPFGIRVLKPVDILRETEIF